MNKRLFLSLLTLLCLTTSSPLRAQEPYEGYQLVWSDEFDQEDYSQPDPSKWRCSTRYSATWNRYIADDPSVVYIKDGSLVCRAIKNPDTSKDNVPMITGSRESRGLFSFTYGRVDIRLRTLSHTGNFPAAWMMPQPPCEGWPKAGEIDIFETIDSQKRAWHTVHSNWTYNLGKTSSPRSSFNEECKVHLWHVYSLEWTEDLLTWYLDGKKVGSYAKSTNQSDLSQGQWPFDHPFYIILNQSVGNGSWAANYDASFTYETRFDYVRVYQKVPDGITSHPTTTSSSSPSSIYDLSGRTVTTPKKGLYIIDGKKTVF